MSLALSLENQEYQLTEAFDENPSGGIIEGFGGNADLDETSQIYEGACYLKTKNDEFKKHWLVMTGNELYFFSKQGASEHKFMHCLSGTYMKDSSNDD